MKRLKEQTAATQAVYKRDAKPKSKVQWSSTGHRLALADEDVDKQARFMLKMATIAKKPVAGPQPIYIEEEEDSKTLTGRDS